MRQFRQRFEHTHPHISKTLGEIWAMTVVSLALVATFVGVNSLLLSAFGLFTYPILWVSCLGVWITLWIGLLVVQIMESRPFLHLERIWAELFWTRVTIPDVDHRVLAESVNKSYMATGNTFWFRDKNDALRVKMCSGFGGWGD